VARPEGGKKGVVRAFLRCGDLTADLNHHHLLINDLPLSLLNLLLFGIANLQLAVHVL
jgi:hypothetical protein